MKKAFVLGGSGFLGSYLIDELKQRRFHVSALVHKTSLPHDNQSVQALSGSLTDFDWSSLEPELPDVIFHAARMGGIGRKTRQKAAAYNKKANERLLSWMKSLDSAPLLVFVSGTLVYGSHGNQPVDESYEPQPISFQQEYFEAEKPVLEAFRESNLPVIIVRPSWIYGPGSWFRAFYLTYMDKNQKVPVYGNGDNLMAFVHVRDCAAMMIHAALHKNKNQVFNLFTSSSFKQKEFSGFLSDYTSLPLKKVPLLWLRIRFDHAVSEAFRFSLNLTTRHTPLWRDYTPYYSSIKSGVKEILSGNPIKNEP